MDDEQQEECPYCDGIEYCEHCDADDDYMGFGEDDF